MLVLATSGGSGSDNITAGVEQKIGTITIGGTTYNRYKIVVPITLSYSAHSYQKNHGVTFMGVLNANGCVAITNGYAPLPYLASTLAASVKVVIRNTYIEVMSDSDSFSGQSGFVTFEYYR